MFLIYVRSRRRSVTRFAFVVLTVALIAVCAVDTHGPLAASLFLPLRVGVFLLTYGIATFLATSEHFWPSDAFVQAQEDRKESIISQTCRGPSWSRFLSFLSERGKRVMDLHASSVDIGRGGAGEGGSHHRPGSAERLAAAHASGTGLGGSGDGGGSSGTAFNRRAVVPLNTKLGSNSGSSSGKERENERERRAFKKKSSGGSRRGSKDSVEKARTTTPPPLDVTLRPTPQEGGNSSSCSSMASSDLRREKSSNMMTLEGGTNRNLKYISEDHEEDTDASDILHRLILVFSLLGAILIPLLTGLVCRNERSLMVVSIILITLNTSIGHTFIVTTALCLATLLAVLVTGILRLLAGPSQTLFLLGFGVAGGRSNGTDLGEAGLRSDFAFSPGDSVLLLVGSLCVALALIGAKHTEERSTRRRFVSRFCVEHSEMKVSVNHGAWEDAYEGVRMKVGAMHPFEMVTSVNPSIVCGFHAILPMCECVASLYFLSKRSSTSFNTNTSKTSSCSERYFPNT